MLVGLLLISVLGSVVCTTLVLLRKIPFPTGMAGTGVCMASYGVVEVLRSVADQRGTFYVVVYASMVVSGAVMAWLALTGRWKGPDPPGEEDRYSGG